MTDSLLHAYLPLFFWSGMGLFLLRFVPDNFPRFLGRSLYWVGVPLEIFSLARQTTWSAEVSTAVPLTVGAILTGLVLAWTVLQGILRLKAKPHPVEAGLLLTEKQPLHWHDRPRQGGFILSSMLGNTGFVGLAIAPVFVSESYVGWLVLYTVTQNLFGTYGMGVFLSSYFGRSAETNRWWIQVRDVLTVPSLWAFVLGSLSQAVPAPEWVETSLRASIWVVIPVALLLMGMRLSQLQGWQSLKLGIVPSLLKAVLVPGLVGLLAMSLQLAPEARLALVLMAGMPTAFAGLILAEEYELDRELIASSIVLSTGLLLVTLPLWLLAFGQH